MNTPFLSFYAFYVISPECPFCQITCNLLCIHVQWLNTWNYVGVAVLPVHCPTDIIFVLDKSGSIRSTNFELVKKFLSQLVGRLDIDSGNTRVGLVTFATRVGFSFNLDEHTTVASVQAAILSLPYSRGKTNTAGALAYVRSYMLKPAAGDRGNVPNIVAVITDGKSSDPRATQVCHKFHSL